MKSSYFASLLLFLIATFSVAQNKSIKEEKFVSIGGIEQWITIKGEDRTKPIVLFIHGGPGSAMSQYDNAIYGKWEKDFILVHWDQRGAGRTYGRNAPAQLNEAYLIENPLTVEQMTKDGIELTKYLIDYLKKDKVILLGSSWGSLLGTEMALSNPELFYAYVGHSQIVNPSKGFIYAYEKTFAMAKKTIDTNAIEKLESFGKPPYNNPRSYGQILRIVKKYERTNSTPAPNTWFKLAPEYDNEKDNKNRYEGDDYSFCNFVGFKKLGVKSMVAEVDFNKTGLEFKIPIYLIQGEKDILTPKEMSKPYFDKIIAPKKEYFLLPNAAHGFNQSVVDKQYEVIKKIEY
ncbi:alpha/beta fold hydrolase [Flavivirga algicola]|uniref:Alpha/beta hydrolase n=1 Tax=Flavivirga algicola TaxID=2729136 RepID=A0ABX1S0A4_9FLAO|nr:alpha/beta hydrolase [Flavivirga algicola]NMH89276.1 alpha/beta hydrolase [Flavivirga algicola]